MTASTLAIRALEYVRNTNGGATQAHFIDDHDPIGQRLLDELFERTPQLITVNHAGRIFLTDAGRAAIAKASPPPGQ